MDFLQSLPQEERASLWREIFHVQDTSDQGQQASPDVADKETQTSRHTSVMVRNADGGIHISLADGSNLDLRGPVWEPVPPK